MTFANMVTRVSELINQPLTDDNKTVTQTEVKANLNIGYQKLVNRVRTLNQDYYVREARTDLVADQETYSLPDDFSKLRKLMIGYNSANQLYSAIRIDRAALMDNDQTFTTARPAYTFISNAIEIFPTPTQAVTNGMFLWYVEEVADLTLDADEPDVPIGYESLPVLYAAAKAKTRLGLLDEARLELEEFREELFNMTVEQTMRADDQHDFVIIKDMYSEV